MFNFNLIKKVFPHAAPFTQSFSRVWTDSRTVQMGDFFAAIKGENFDGHDYIKGAAERGALGALVSTENFPGRKELPADFLIVHVDNTIQALRQLAAAYRE